MSPSLEHSLVMAGLEFLLVKEAVTQARHPGPSFIQTRGRRKRFRRCSSSGTCPLATQNAAHARAAVWLGLPDAAPREQLLSPVPGPQPPTANAHGHPAGQALPPPFYGREAEPHRLQSWGWLSPDVPPPLPELCPRPHVVSSPVKGNSRPRPGSRPLRVLAGPADA